MDYSRIKEEARAALSGKWGTAIGIYLIFLLITVPVQFVPKIGGLIGLLCAGPFTVGFSRFSLNVIRNEEAVLEDLFFGFKQFGRSFGAMFLVNVFVLLWALLLIIPGIIAAYSYSMVPYILADDEHIDVIEALAKSKKMMNGYKADLFVLQISFIGWAILCLLTLGIGFLWLGPWQHVSTAKFYLEVKANWEAQTGINNIPEGTSTSEIIS